MRKLLLIAAMLMLPAIALADTDVTWSETVVNTGLEEFNYGPIHGQSDSNGHFWGNWSGNVNIIDDPTGAGRGKVAAWQPPEQGDVNRLFVDRTDHEWVITHSAGGVMTWESDLFVFSNLGDYTNLAYCEHGVGGVYYLDGGSITPGDTIEGFISGPQWAPFDPGLVTVTAGPLPVDQWFTVGVVADYGTLTSELYINGVKSADITLIWPEDNSIHWEHHLLDQFLPEGCSYMLLDQVTWTFAIPEPSILVLGGFGLVTLLVRRKKK